MRTGWLLWQESLRQFLYFEQEMLPPNPDDYYAEWVKHDIGRGSRKGSQNLWVYERETGKKRYSITTQAGAKIQPYFDVPPPNDPNLYLFTVIGEVIDNGMVRVWVTDATARELARLIGGDFESRKLSELIIRSAEEISKLETVERDETAKVVSLLVSKEAYDILRTVLPGVSDEHSFQLLTHYLLSERS